MQAFASDVTIKHEHFLCLGVAPVRLLEWSGAIILTSFEYGDCRFEVAIRRGHICCKCSDSSIFLQPPRLQALAACVRCSWELFARNARTICGCKAAELESKRAGEQEKYL